jgi:hypothetical protein
MKTTKRNGAPLLNGSTPFVKEELSAGLGSGYRPKRHTKPLWIRRLFWLAPPKWV